MKNKYFYIGCACIIAYMLPYLILGENAYITIHDFLDQNVVIMAMLKKTGLLTSISGIVPNMDGLDRSLFPFFTPFDVKMVCYALLPTYWAIITYSFVYKAVAFIGMYLLLDKYVFKKEYQWITMFLSLGFALVPFYMELAISGAGFPLLTYAFLNLYYKKNRMWSYVAIAFYSFNSLLAYGGFFFLVILCSCLILNYSHTKKFPKYVIIGVGIMCGVYLLANWGTIYSLFFSEDFVSHRAEWIHTTSLIEDVKDFLLIIVFSQYHAGTCFALPILAFFFTVFFLYRRQYPILDKVAFLYCVVILGIFVGTLLKHSHIQLFVTIQFDRFYFFYPSVIFILLASSCYVFVREKKSLIAIPITLYGLVCGIYYDPEFRANSKLMAGVPIEAPTFKQFYDVNLFNNIHKDLGTSDNYQTKTVSVGMFPCIAEYNGFWTMDSYRVNYSANYKHTFRKVIEKELEKDDSLREYYDSWGSRCYVFSSELDKANNRYLCGKNSNVVINQLLIDTEILRDMGCEYIISAVDILNYNDIGLKYVNSYTTDSSFWTIRIYRLI